MEASALQAPTALSQTKVALATPLLRFRSDEQLVALFRAGYDDAFRVIHERYHKRLFAYTRQMLPGRQDAEDALQDVFVRAYSGLRASDRQLALRAWLFRVAHNRCIDELRRPAPPPPEVLVLVRSTTSDPLAEVDLRESMRRLIEDIRRLPEQQRSALLMRELGGVSYADLATSLGISVGAVKSLLVRARIGLAQATAARDTACGVIREQLVEAHDRGIRPDPNVRRHMRDCTGCKSFRRELRGVSRQLAAVAPAVGPLGLVAKVLGFSSGGGAGGGAALLGGGGGAAASAGGLAVGVNHVATLIVAAVATAGGAVGIQHTIVASAHHPAHHHRPAGATTRSTGRQQPVPTGAYKEAAGIQDIATAVEASVSATPAPALLAASPTAQPKPRKSAERDAATKPRGTSSTRRKSTLAPAAGKTTATSTTGGTACPSVSTTTSSTPPAPASTTSASAAPTATTSDVQPTTCTATTTGSTPGTTSSTTASTSGTTPSSTSTGSASGGTSSTPSTPGSTSPGTATESGTPAPVG